MLTKKGNKWFYKGNEVPELIGKNEGAALAWLSEKAAALEANQKAERQPPTNVAYELQGNTLTLKVDLSQSHGKSKGGEGKTTIVASTHGNLQFDVNGRKVSVGLNAYHK